MARHIKKMRSYRLSDETFDDIKRMADQWDVSQGEVIEALVNTATEQEIPTLRKPVVQWQDKPTVSV